MSTPRARRRRGPDVKDEIDVESTVGAVRECIKRAAGLQQREATLQQRVDADAVEVVDQRLIQTALGPTSMSVAPTWRCRSRSSRSQRGEGWGRGKGGAGRRRGHQAATRPGSRRRQLVHPHHAGDAPGYEPASRLGGLWRPGRGGAGRGDVRAVQEAAVINGAYPANRHAEGQPDVVASLYDRDALPETDPPTQDA